MEQLLSLITALALLAFALFLGFQSLTLLAGQWRAWRGASSSTSWASTDGVIEQSRLTFRGVRSPRAHPIVTYHYQANGREYPGERIDFCYARLYDTAEAEAILARYPSGAGVTVHYDPENPAESALEQRHSGLLGGLFAGLVLLVPTLLCAGSGLIGLTESFWK